MVIVARRGWALAARGGVTLALIFVVLAQPAADATLKTAFSAFALAIGLLTLMMVGSSPEAARRWWAFTLDGLLSLTAGAVALLLDLGPAVLSSLIAAWALADGVLQLVAAARLRRSIPGELLLGLSGVAALLFGTAVAALARMQMGSLVPPLVAFALVSGAALLRLGLRLHVVGHNQGGPVGLGLR